MATEQSDAIQLSLPLPKSLDTRIYIRLSTQAKAILVSLTTASQDEPASVAPMGSFVYALPNKFNPSQPLATNLFPHEPTLEFTTRMAKLLAKKTNLPVYVTNSVSFLNSGMGGTVEEEMEAFKNVAEVLIDKIRTSGLDAAAINGK